MPFVVHHLGDRLYGLWTLAFAFIGYYSLVDFGFSQSAVSQYISIAIGHNDLTECRAVFNTALRIQLLLGGVALLVTAAILAWPAPWFCRSPEDGAMLWKIIAVLGVTVALGIPLRAYGFVLEAQLRFDIQSWLMIFGSALRIGLTGLGGLEGVAELLAPRVDSVTYHIAVQLDSSLVCAA